MLISYMIEQISRLLMVINTHRIKKSIYQKKKKKKKSIYQWGKNCLQKEYQWLF